jgi:hypothetical protein
MLIGWDGMEGVSFKTRLLELWEGVISCGLRLVCEVMADFARGTPLVEE